MLSLADMVHFLTDELTGLRRGRLPFTFILARPLNCFFLWHDNSLLGPNDQPAPNGSTPQRPCQISLILQ